MNYSVIVIMKIENVKIIFHEKCKDLLHETGNNEEVRVWQILVK